MLTREERIAIGLAACGLGSLLAGMCYDAKSFGIMWGFIIIAVLGFGTAFLNYLNGD